MLHILLLILKIIGIILAVLIGCILLTLCLALFVPVRYRVELKRTEAEGSPPIEVKAKITWLLHFINIRIIYPSDIYLKVRILFITLFRLPQKKKRNRKKDIDTKGESNKKKKEKSKVTEEAQTHGQSNVNINTEKITTEQNGKDTTDKSLEAETSGNADEETQNSNPKLSLKDKLNKLWNLFKNIWYTIIGICDKIKEILENIEYYLDIIKSDTFKQAFSLCKDELVSILNYIKPRKFIADLIIGMDDPAATGQILSYYGMLYPLIGNNVTVTGDFDMKRIEGSVFFKGRIKLFTFLKAVIRIYFSKDIKKLLKLFKKEDA